MKENVIKKVSEKEITDEELMQITGGYIQPGYSNSYVGRPIIAKYGIKPGSKVGPKAGILKYGTKPVFKYGAKPY